MALKVISSRLPMGVGTRKSLPVVMLCVQGYYSSLIVIIASLHKTRNSLLITRNSYYLCLKK
jgi:hypothetical protein